MATRGEQVRYYPTGFIHMLLLAGVLPVCIAVTALQHLDDLWEQVGGISGTQQVQQNLLAVFVVDDFVQRRQDFLSGAKVGLKAKASRRRRLFSEISMTH